MNTVISPADRYAQDVRHYEQEDIVRLWLSAYEIEKERQLIKSINRFIPQDQLRLLDIGCGTGLHTSLWHEQGKAVTASDISVQFGDYIIHTYPFPFIRMDVLNCTLTEQYDICFCMAVATILLDEELRFQTFRTLARLVRPGSFLVLITGSNQKLFFGFAHHALLHSLDQRDLRKLVELGFAVERVFYWGCTPRWLWRWPLLRPLARCVEALGSGLDLGARKVVICRRLLNDTQPTSL